MPSPNGWTEVTIDFSSNPLIDPLLRTWTWDAESLTFSFPAMDSVWSTNIVSGYGATSTSGEPWSDMFLPLYAADQEFFRHAMWSWAACMGLEISEVTETSTLVGDIRAAYSYQRQFEDSHAWTYVPSWTASAGDIWFNARGAAALDLWVPGSYSYFAVVHEIGHALGLKHPFEGYRPLPAEYDSQVYTVMSYAALNGDRDSVLTFYPTTPMLLDVLAIQHVYGENTGHNAGATSYFYDDTETYMQTIWDGGGNDTISYAGVLSATIDLRPGHGSSVGDPVYAVTETSWVPVNNVWIAYGTEIENALSGAGNDTLTGNALNNRLSGGAGNDRLSGGAGDDYLIGGAGADVIDGGAGYNVAYLSGLSSSYRTQVFAGVREMRGPDGLDLFTSVSRFQFDDVSLAFDINGHAGQAYRLYRAAFDRVPDLPGMGYQMRALDEGLSLQKVASNFIASPEFQRTYGSVNDTQFVTLLYRNVLDREPDASGLQYHVSRLAGTASRADVLIGFSESPENQAAVIGVIQSGIAYT